ncbi:NAD-dependent epimerase/dehydratase [Tolypothrix tenuis PCC 7101]|uniref:NAD-dependent epimerase/dehydratase n=1 Tax=Tolypothrix tenuis PCC 7101 TaxID=231146 RepID=A0A1Z4N763_9CYAN|nr:SDR family oxidoreductase [Aulosira sp. FACHB-113]BAZ01554.1 NAD-dependent epimerase/dehydratase [Tolypothrix tenuis PCC 7101]BAZ74520.1 NAD-dependent epimerase/dehydratase [Aulosira laxa NIES-50]
MKVLVTGTEGYIGSLLAPLLIQQGYEVIAVDTGFYKVGWLYNGTELTAKTLNKDIRNITASDLEGVDAIVHMAELSNDPLGQLAPTITYDINHKGSVHLAKLAKEAGVRRFVYTSSCSVYGFATEDYVDEESTINPQTAYAKCKGLVEQDVKQLADDSFSPTFLRNATAYGASPRMRFDIVLNNLSGWAWTIKEIKMNSDGTPWRPLVHILDICKAIICTLEAPRDVIHNQIFNVGDTNGNYQVKQIAEIVADVFTGCQLSFGKHDPDNRSYRVSFDKINKNLPGFKCEWDAQRGAQQLYNVFKQIDMTREVFESRGFTRLKQLEYLIRTQQIDQDFFWRTV